MKKFVLLFVLAAAVASSVAITSASGGTPNPVATATGFACNVFDRDGSLFTTFQSTSTLYASGKEVLHCIGQGTPGDTIVTQSGFACGMFFDGVSTDPANSSRVGRDGESQLWCFAHGVGAPTSSVGAQ